MKKLTHSKLVAMLEGYKGTVIVGLLALTDSKARKTGNPFGTIFKQVRATGFVGVDYGASVNREATRQGGTETFQSENLPWGQWLLANKVIENKGELYLRTQTTPGIRRKVAARVLAYRDAQGKFIAPDEAKKFIPVAAESVKQQVQTGIEKTVWVRTYKFNSIQKIRIAGETFQLVPDVGQVKVIRDAITPVTETSPKIESEKYVPAWQRQAAW